MRISIKRWRRWGRLPVFHWLWCFGILHPRVSLRLFQALSICIGVLVFFLARRLWRAVDEPLLEILPAPGIWVLLWLAVTWSGLMQLLLLLHRSARNIGKRLFIDAFQICVLRRFDVSLSRTMRVHLAPLIGRVGAVHIVSDPSYEEGRKGATDSAPHEDDILGGFDERARLTDAQWKNNVRQMIRAAGCCVFDVTDFSDNMRWEFAVALMEQKPEHLVVIAQRNDDLESFRVWSAAKRRELPALWWAENCLVYGKRVDAAFRKALVRRLVRVRGEVLESMGDRVGKFDP